MKRLIGVALVLLAACSGTAAVQTTRGSVEAFRQSYNAGNIDAIYATADPEFKRTTSRERFGAFLTEIHGRLGAFKTATSKGWHDSYDANGHLVTLDYAAEYERGAATEQFIYRFDEQRPHLARFESR